MLPQSTSPYPKSPAGRYLDHEGYLHICFWDNSKKKYVVIIKNAQGKHCSSSAYDRNQAWEQVRGLQKQP